MPHDPPHAVRTLLQEIFHRYPLLKESLEDAAWAPCVISRREFHPDHYFLIDDDELLARAQRELDPSIYRNHQGLDAVLVLAQI